MQQSDVEVLAVLVTETFPTACLSKIADEDIAVFVGENLSPEWLRTYLDAPLHVVPVYETGEGLDDYLLMTADDDLLPDPSFGVMHLSAIHLSKCCVCLNRHSGTVSRAPLNEAKRVAVAGLRVTFIWPDANQDSVRACRFYEKRDFARVGAKTMPVGDHARDDYVYEHILVTS